MFNQIASSYDFINRLITFGMDVSWRKQVVNRLPSNCRSVLDIASGTMDVAIAIATNHVNKPSVIALDMAENMLSIGQQKCQDLGIESIQTVVADVHQLPFKDGSFCSATVAFGIRNFEQLDVAFKEVFRVLSHGGDLIILESSNPSNACLRWMNRLFLNTWVRLMGLLFSGKGDSYGYLAKSIQEFESSAQLVQLLKQSGFTSVGVDYFMCQSVQLIHAKK